MLKVWGQCWIDRFDNQLFWSLLSCWSLHKEIQDGQLGEEAPIFAFGGTWTWTLLSEGLGQWMVQCTWGSCAWWGKVRFTCMVRGIFSMGSQQAYGNWWSCDVSSWVYNHGRVWSLCFWFFMSQLQGNHPVVDGQIKLDGFWIKETTWPPFAARSRINPGLLAWRNDAFAEAGSSSSSYDTERWIWSGSWPSFKAQTDGGQWQFPGGIFTGGSGRRVFRKRSQWWWSWWNGNSRSSALWWASTWIQRRRSVPSPGHESQIFCCSCKIRRWKIAMWSQPYSRVFWHSEGGAVVCFPFLLSVWKSED